jgi:hypothetical protein
MLDGILNFEWKRMKNVVNYQQLLFTEKWRHSKFGCDLCKIRWEKHCRAFVKVVEGSEIYNFPIHHSVHFSCKISRKTVFKTAKLCCTGACRAATSCRAPERARARRATSATPYARRDSLRPPGLCACRAGVSFQRWFRGRASTWGPRRPRDVPERPRRRPLPVTPDAVPPQLWGGSLHCEGRRPPQL